MIFCHDLFFIGPFLGDINGNTHSSHYAAVKIIQR